MNISDKFFLYFHTDFHPSHVNNIKFLINNLEPATFYRLKCYSIHSKSQSEPIWLNAETIESPQKLIDYQGSFFADIPNYLTNHKLLLVSFLIVIAVVLLLISLGLITLLKKKKSGSDSFISSNEKIRAPQTQATIFDEQDTGCDETITPIHVSKNNTQRLSVRQLTKGPPDIIPSIGYSSGSGLDKQYISYSKFNYE